MSRILLAPLLPTCFTQWVCTSVPRRVEVASLVVSTLCRERPATERPGPRKPVAVGHVLFGCGRFLPHGQTASLKIPRGGGALCGLAWWARAMEGISKSRSGESSEEGFCSYVEPWTWSVFLNKTNPSLYPFTPLFLPVITDPFVPGPHWRIPNAHLPESSWQKKSKKWNPSTGAFSCTDFQKCVEFGCNLLRLVKSVINSSKCPGYNEWRAVQWALDR